MYTSIKSLCIHTLSTTEEKTSETSNASNMINVSVDSKPLIKDINYTRYKHLILFENKSNFELFLINELVVYK